VDLLGLLFGEARSLDFFVRRERSRNHARGLDTRILRGLSECHGVTGLGWSWIVEIEMLVNRQPFQ
jgi:hypothetical protein